MGTNYYAHMKPCPTCHRSAEEVHLGKSSGGLRFALHVQRQYYTDWAEFQEFLERDVATIHDEYGVEWSVEELIGKIMAKQHDDRDDRDFKDGPVDLADYNFPR